MSFLSSGMLSPRTNCLVLQSTVLGEKPQKSLSYKSMMHGNPEIKYFEGGYMVIKNTSVGHKLYIYNYAGDLLVFRDIHTLYPMIDVMSNSEHLIIIDDWRITIYLLSELKAIPQHKLQEFKNKRQIEQRIRRVDWMHANDGNEPVEEIHYFAAVRPYVIHDISGWQLTTSLRRYNMKCATLDDSFYLVFKTDSVMRSIIILNYTSKCELISVNMIPDENQWEITRYENTAILFAREDQYTGIKDTCFRNIEWSYNTRKYVIPSALESSDNILWNGIKFDGMFRTQTYPGRQFYCNADEWDKDKDKDKDKDAGEYGRLMVVQYDPRCKEFPMILTPSNICFLSDNVVYTTHTYSCKIRKWILPRF